MEKMDFQNPRKRTLLNNELNNNKNQIPSQKYRVLSSKFDDNIPMTLNTWTQTTSEDFACAASKENSGGGDNLQEQTLHNRIQKLEKALEMQTELLNQIVSNRNGCNTPFQFSPTTNENSVQYTIIADGKHSTVRMIEPIEVQLSDRDQEDECNISDESGRLQICTEIEAEADANEEKENQIDNCKTENPNQSNPPSTSLNILTNTNSTNIQQNPTTNNKIADVGTVLVSIGPNNTRIPAELFQKMNWSSGSIATRKLLMATFDRETLATHTMTGRPSPAFKEQGKPLKRMLDPNIVSDIIFAVTRKTGVTAREVRGSITTKCADENKIYRQKIKRNSILNETNKENNV